MPTRPGPRPRRASRRSGAFAPTGQRRPARELATCAIVQRSAAEQGSAHGQGSSVRHEDVRPVPSAGRLHAAIGLRSHARLPPFRHPPRPAPSPTPPARAIRPYFRADHGARAQGRPLPRHPAPIARRRRRCAACSRPRRSGDGVRRRGIWRQARRHRAAMGARPHRRHAQLHRRPRDLRHADRAGRGWLAAARHHRPARAARTLARRVAGRPTTFNGVRPPAPGACPHLDGAIARHHQPAPVRGRRRAALSWRSSPPPGGRAGRRQGARLWRRLLQLRAAGVRPSRHRGRGIRVCSSTTFAALVPVVEGRGRTDVRLERRPADRRRAPATSSPSATPRAPTTCWRRCARRMGMITEV